MAEQKHWIKAKQESKAVGLRQMSKFTLGQINKMIDRELEPSVSEIGRANNIIDNLINSFNSLSFLTMKNKDGYEKINEKIAHLLELKKVIVPNLLNNRLNLNDIDRTKIEKGLNKNGR